MTAAARQLVRTLPERGSQTLTWPSWEAAATQLPDGLHAHAMPASVKKPLHAVSGLNPAAPQDRDLEVILHCTRSH